MSPTNQPPHLSVLLKGFAKLAGGGSFLVGLGLLIGGISYVPAWRNFGPEAALSEVELAVGLVAAGLSLEGLLGGVHVRGKHLLARVCAGATTFVGLLALGGSLFKGNGFGGTMAGISFFPSTSFSVWGALSFLLLGPALWLLDAEAATRWKLGQLLALGGTVVALLAFWRFPHHAGWFGKRPLDPAWSLASVVTLLGLAAGVLCARPEAAWMSEITQDTIGGRLARRLLPPALVVPFLIAWGLSVLDRPGSLGIEQDDLAFAAIVAAIFTVLIWLNARTLNRREAERRQTFDSHRRLAAVVESSEEAIFSKTLEGTIVSWNRAAERLYGYTADEILGQSVSRLVPSDRQPELDEIMEQIRRGRAVRRCETLRRRKDGALVQVGLSVSPILDEAGRVQGASSVGHDITERKEAEARIYHLNRILRAVRDVNVLIAREDDPRRFLPEACRVMVQTRGYGLVWIARPEAGSSQVAVLAAAGIGTTGHNRELLALDAEAPGGGPIATALQTRRPCVCQDVASDPRLGTWKRAAEACGFAAVAVVPMNHGSRLFGTVNVWADHPAAFDDEELALLEELAGDLALAMQSAENESERQQVELKMQLLSSALESAGSAVLITDRAGHIEWVNPAFVRLTGYSAAEAVGQHTRLLKSGHHDQTFYQNLWETILGGQVWRAEIVNRRKDGTLYSEQNTITPVRTAEGEIQNFVAVKEDITERKQAESALRESELNYRRLVERSPDAILVQAEGRFVFANPTALKLLGAERLDQLQGRSVSDVFVSDDTTTDVKTGVTDQAEDDSSLREQTIVCLDGTRIDVEMLAIPFKYHGQPAIQTILRDITQRRKWEGHVRQVQKMEALGTLAGGIAHDFNNILVGIITFAELARMDAADNRAVVDSLTQVLKASERAKSLVHQILTFSRKQAQERRPVQLQPLIKEGVKLLRSTLPSTIEFISRIEQGAPVVLADPTQIHQVLMNLCTNAAHAIGNRPGRLGITFMATEVDAALAQVQPDLRPGRYARLTVSDTGRGMSAETMKHLYEPFFTTKPPGEGTGLGLSVVHGIMKDHEGGIVVFSQEGRGTTFSLYFPEYVGSENALPMPTTEMAHGQGQRVLFVDDERALVQSARLVLGRLGYHVTAEVNPLRALELFRTKPRDFDLVLTDLTMPALTGVDLARKVMEIRPDIPVLLATGFSGFWTRERARELGIKDLVMKPFSPADLASLIQRTLTEAKTSPPPTSRPLPPDASPPTD